MRYTNQDLVEGHLGRDLTDREAELFNTLVVAVERLIDQELGTTFKNDASVLGVSKYFDGGTRFTSITPVQNITSIQIVDSDLVVTDTLETNQYVLRPDDTGVVRSLDIRYGRLPRGFNNIKITGDFTEYGAEEDGVPSDIQIIATRMVAGMLENTEVAQGIKSEKIEGHEVTYGEGAVDIFESDPVIKKLMGLRRGIYLASTSNFKNYDEEAEILGIY